MDALTVHRLHFAFTVTFHTFFPQLTMGLALLIVVLKTMALRTGNDHYNRAARFWPVYSRSISLWAWSPASPWSFSFGTNWARFSKAAGGVIGQTLAMEGVFSFFPSNPASSAHSCSERSAFGPKAHWVSAFLVFAGSWLSGFFIVATDAWMQHPTGYRIGANGEILLSSLWGLLLNPWLFWQYLHNMIGSVVTASFVMAAVGAFYLLTRRHEEFGRTFRAPGGDRGHGLHHPDGRSPPAMDRSTTSSFISPRRWPPWKACSTPNRARRSSSSGSRTSRTGVSTTLSTVPNALSFLTYQRWKAEVKGLDAFPPDRWPDNIPLLYYSYHIMVGLEPSSSR